MVTQQLTNGFFSFTRTLAEALECGKEAQVVSLDISKTFDKVCHAGLLRKFDALGVLWPLLQCC